LVAAGIIDWWARNSSDQTTGAVASAELAVLCYSANWKQLISDSSQSEGALGPRLHPWAEYFKVHYHIFWLPHLSDLADQYLGQPTHSRIIYPGLLN
jgi:hypothetical protein